MPRVSKEDKEKIKDLSKFDLENIVIKFASNKEVYDYLYVTYFNNESGAIELFEKTQDEILDVYYKNYKGYAEQPRKAKSLSACIKKINEFVKVVKDPKAEADLILFVLEIEDHFSNELLGTCFTVYDYKIALLVKRLITVVTKKLHRDYLIEYQSIINEFLEKLHSCSNHMDMVYAMPKSI